MIKAENITVTAGSQCLLDNVSCNLHAGELVCVVGCNGAGKSTLLKTLAGDWRPTAGHIFWGEQALSAFSHQTLALRRAVMPQQVQLDFPFRAMDVVAMGRMPYQESRQQTQTATLACMALTDTRNLRDRLYPSLSGGEQQRVQLARVLNQLWPFAQLQARFLFLDETTASLDPLHQQRVFALAQWLTELNIGVLAVVHDMNLAAQFADRVWLVDKGKIRASGTPAEVLTEAHIANAFGGLRVRCEMDTCTGRPWIKPLRPERASVTADSV